MLRSAIICALLSVALGGVARNRSLHPQLDGRIVGGWDTDTEAFPYQASLEWYSFHICGGSIISELFIVTAAHCTDGSSPRSLRVRVGSSVEGQNGQLVQVEQIKQHPNYNRRLMDFDVSILILSLPLNFGLKVKPIRLAEDNQSISDGTWAVVTGWGATSEEGPSSKQLQAVEIPIVDQAECKNAYGSSSVTDNMICAGFKEGGKDACQGDSGGPLATGGVFIGIASWGYGCARLNYPGVYASVPSLRGFIREVTGV